MAGTDLFVREVREKKGGYRYPALHDTEQEQPCPLYLETEQESEQFCRKRLTPLALFRGSADADLAYAPTRGPKPNIRGHGRN